ncbi:MAG TPA: rhomboid family intramembrane serine protease [Ktedonobacterales bacterium]|jgi:membrane associated rhomboid family serine protease|nr:rhomboid family intramembrane serine protease [Ktedonobacterales bacterium]
MEILPYALAVVIMSAIVNGLIGSAPESWGLSGRADRGAGGKYPLPITTIVVVVITAIFTGLQFPFPAVLEALRRNPQALAGSEWWRMVTPMLVHSDGWAQIIFNFVAIIIFGALAERVFGHWWWLLLYLGGGIVGEIAGYLWDPFGAGASVGLFGLLGGLLLWLLLSLDTPRARIAAVIGLLVVVALLIIRDIHGYAALAGVCLALLPLWGVQVGKKRTEEASNT